LINGLIWRANPRGNTPPAAALKNAFAVAAIVAAIFIVDIGVGFIQGQRTFSEALLKGAPFGGIADLLLAALGVFVGIPTCIRAVILFYERQRT
jgi:hypothetical protein